MSSVLILVRKAGARPRRAGSGRYSRPLTRAAGDQPSVWLSGPELWRPQQPVHQSDREERHRGSETRVSSPTSDRQVLSCGGLSAEQMLSSPQGRSADSLAVTSTFVICFTLVSMLLDMLPSVYSSRDLEHWRVHTLGAQQAAQSTTVGPLQVSMRLQGSMWARWQ